MFNQSMTYHLILTYSLISYSHLLIGMKFIVTKLTRETQEWQRLRHVKGTEKGWEGGGKSGKGGGAYSVTLPCLF